MSDSQEKDNTNNLVELNIADDYYIYSLMVTPETHRRAVCDSEFANSLLKQMKDKSKKEEYPAHVTDVASTSKTSTTIYPSDSACLSKHSTKNNNFNLELTDQSSGERYKLYLDEETYNRAKSDVYFATKLLNSQKKLIQECHTIKAPEYETQKNCVEYDESNDEDEDLENEEGFEIKENIKGNNRHVWKEAQTKFLICQFKMYDDEFSSGRLTHKKFWRKIADDLKEKGYNVSVAQCISKMDSLKRIYKKTKDHNSQSGNDKKSCSFYEELDELFCKKPWIKPVSLAGSNMPLSDMDQNDQCTVAKRPRSLSKVDAFVLLQQSLDEQHLHRRNTEMYRKRKLDLMEELLQIFKKN